VKLLQFPIIKLTICLVIGIILSRYVAASILHASIITLLLFIGLLITYLLSKPLFTKNIWFGLLAFLTVISIGVLVVNIHDQRNFKNHYSHFKNFKNGSESFITLKITEVLKPNIYNDK